MLLLFLLHRSDFGKPSKKNTEKEENYFFLRKNKKLENNRKILCPADRALQDVMYDNYYDQIARGYLIEVRVQSGDR